MLGVLLGILAFVTMSLPASALAWAACATLAVNGVKRGAVVYLPSTYDSNQQFLFRSSSMARTAPGLAWRI